MENVNAWVYHFLAKVSSARSLLFTYIALLLHLDKRALLDIIKLLLFLMNGGLLENVNKGYEKEHITPIFSTFLSR